MSGPQEEKASQGDSRQHGKGHSASDHPALTLALMAGLPGSGKTTLARALGKNLGWLVIDKDSLIQQFLRDGLDDDKASYFAYEASFNAVRESLKSNHSVILETAALYSFILEEFQKITSEMGPVPVRLKVLLLVANREVRNERIRHRPPHDTVIRADPATVDEYLNMFSHLPLPPGSFYLDTSTQQPEDYLSRARYYLTSDDEVYDDDVAKLKSMSLPSIL